MLLVHLNIGSHRHSETIPVRYEKEKPFEGFSKLICSPLELADPASFKRVINIVDTMPAFQTEPFRFIINTLADVSIPEDAARATWKKG